MTGQHDCENGKYCACGIANFVCIKVCRYWKGIGISMALSKEEIFKKKPSPEETKYTSAVELMEAIDCVERFERTVESLRSAAQMFEELGGYQDAANRHRECISLAEKFEKDGCEETYQHAEEMRSRAKTKSAFMAAISEFRRLKSFEAFREQAEEKEEACQKAIRKLETKKVYKRQGIALLTLVIICVIIMQTPLAFVIKGLGHKVRGNYRAAIKCYAQVSELPGVGKLEKSCYYKIAEKYNKEKHYRKAMKAYRKAGAYANAEYWTTRYQKRYLRKADKGDTVFYAGMRWVVLDKQTLDGKALLIRKAALNNEEMLPAGKDFTEKELLQYLNNEFISQNFSDREKVMMGKEVPAKKRAGVEVVQTEPDNIVENPLFLLSNTVLEGYREQLPDNWEWDDGGNGIRRGDIHPAVWVTYH